MTLDELARKHGTDKWDESHAFLGESYLDVYERYLAPLRERPVQLLELGVKRGGSLRMWKEYFPAGWIYGVDVDPRCAAHAEDRIEVLIASQDDAASLGALARRAGAFDVIIDDASHINVLTVASFEILFPFLRPGGFYVIEDTGMSHVDLSRHVHQDWFMDGEALANQRRGVDLRQTRSQLDRLLGRLLHDLDMRVGSLRFVHFWSNLVVMQKAGPA